MSKLNSSIIQSIVTGIIAVLDCMQNAAATFALRCWIPAYNSGHAETPIVLADDATLEQIQAAIRAHVKAGHIVLETCPSVLALFRDEFEAENLKRRRLLKRNENKDVAEKKNKASVSSMYSQFKATLGLPIDDSKGSGRKTGSTKADVPAKGDDTTKGDNAPLGKSEPNPETPVEMILHANKPDDALKHVLKAFLAEPNGKERLRAIITELNVFSIVKKQTKPTEQTK